MDLSPDKRKAPYESRDILVYAPDHRKLAHIVKDQWWVEDAGKRITPENPALLYPAELAWAPDSRALFITTSIGYTTGYQLHIYRLSDTNLVAVPNIDKTVRRDFERHHRCVSGDVGNTPNVAGVIWLDGSERILVAAEVPPLGICKEAHYFGGYELSISSGQIVTRFSPQELATRWTEVLGERLRGDLGLMSAEAKAKLP